jgi:hypothetical protein
VTEQHRRREPHAADRLGMLRRHRLIRLVEVGQDAAPSKVDAALLGQRSAARGTAGERTPRRASSAAGRRTTAGTDEPSGWRRW